MKLLKDSGEVSLFENRKSVGCPVCERPFHRVLITEAATRSFEGLDTPVCVGRDEGRLYLFTHP